MNLTPEELKAAQLANYQRKVDRETKAALCPVAQTVEALDCDRPHMLPDKVETSLHEVVEQTVAQKDFKALEGMLTTNAYSLNHVFHKLLKKASERDIDSYPERLKTVIDMAMKAQRQLTSTIDLLSRLKNPPASTLIQQNIAQNQQVNNGIPSPAQKPTNELYVERTIDNEPLDTGKPPTSQGTDKELAAMEEVNRSEDT